MTKPRRKLEFLTAQEVAAKLDVTPARVHQLVAAGELKIAVTLGARTPLFAVEDVERIKAAKIADLIQRVEKLKST